MEKIGIEISVDPMPPFHPVTFRTEQGEYDVAFVTTVAINELMLLPMGPADFNFVSPEELQELANRPKGEQLISGWGKRMCCMALKALCHSPNRQYRKEAQRMLRLIQAGLFIVPK